MEILVGTVGVGMDGGWLEKLVMGKVRWDVDSGGGMVGGVKVGYCWGGGNSNWSTIFQHYELKKMYIPCHVNPFK